jgi:hypothetical protein
MRKILKTIALNCAVGVAASAGVVITAGTALAQGGVGGFFRQADQPAVMFQYTLQTYCHVQNEAQMAAYGGFSRVQVVPRLMMMGRQTGTCGWPNGFYRRSDRPEVYRLSGRGVVPNVGPDICHVVNEQQMAAYGGFRLVKVVPPTSDIGRGRRPVTPCPNP